MFLLESSFVNTVEVVESKLALVRTKRDRGKTFTAAKNC